MVTSSIVSKETILECALCGNIVFVETKEELTASVIDLGGRVIARFTEDDADEQAHMRRLCSPDAQRALDQMSVEMLHLLGSIPSSDEDALSINVVGLSQRTGIPKGTVSKRLQRLTEIGVVTRHQIPGNRKEVHLRATPLGEEVQAAHRSLHEQMGDVLGVFLKRYSADDLGVLHRVLGELLRMPREGVRYRPDLLE